ncbi:ggdef family protein [Nautilia profundicola AmH]|uniref:Ggdef family protein n=1 Tax=Nautilia profundicola (strain ATCC BAA-1463 / DSM 18972 / AmH) TaxID=598659 RepID=B9L7U1_NAUPA|nr:sensor domain-containing phosphodiesterase [Nautilia profundicola]ACM93273.1 ggdef family protein [Nautilia profundicola AmH]
MRGAELFKKKIIKINFFSIFSVIILFAILSFSIVYLIVQASLQRDIEYTKNEYINTKKTIIKNQVDNLINYINEISIRENQKYLYKLQESVSFLTNILKKESPKNFEYILKQFAKKHPEFIVAMSDLDGNKIYANFKEYNKTKRKQFINEMQKGLIKSDNYFTFKTSKGLLYITGTIFTNKNNNKQYFVTNAILKSAIDNSIKRAVINMVDNARFVFNNGYVAIIEIINIDKDLGKFVAMPIRPDWEGKYINELIKNPVQLKHIRKCLMMLREKGEGFFDCFNENLNTQFDKKISFLKYYEPFNWALIGNIYINEVNNLIAKKQKQIKKELQSIFFLYIVISLVFLVIVYFLTKYENNLLSSIIDKYENKIQAKNKKLQTLNDNLQKEVDRKTNELIQHFLVDPLTGLPNREKLISDMKNYKYVAILNIDYFKEINDFYGMDIGDDVLKTVSSILSEISDTYKLPADEFAFVENDIEMLEEKVKKAIKKIESHKLIVDDGSEVEISISAGIGKNLIEAEMALKLVKSDKTIKMAVYNDNLPIVKEFENNIKWKNILKKVIKEKRVIPYIHPIVNSDTFEIKKYECLMRIEHEGKIYTPENFLEISKKTGQYFDLQKIMIEKCFEKFSKLDYKFSINLSAFELSNEQFRKFLIDKIDEYNIAEKLIIEILEDEELHNEELMGYLIFLHNLDVQFAIDDFGSGHSNLAYLVTKLPVSILKIDGSLIRNIENNANNYKLVKALTNMAKIFNLSVVAEYVENEKIAEMLKELGIEYLQGYFFSKPINLNEL